MIRWFTMIVETTSDEIVALRGSFRDGGELTRGGVVDNQGREFFPMFSRRVVRVIGRGSKAGILARLAANGWPAAEEIPA